MDLIGLKFACSPKMSLATDKRYWWRHHFNSTKRIQHQPGMGFKTLALFLNSAPPAELSNIVIVRITY